MIRIFCTIDQKFLIVFIVIGEDVCCVRYIAVFLKAFNLLQHCIVFVDGAFKCFRERVSRAFQPFEEVGLHHADEKFLTVLLIKTELLFLICQPLFCCFINNITGGSIDG